MTRHVLAVLSATLVLVVGCGNDTTDTTGGSTTSSPSTTATVATTTTATTTPAAPNLEDVVVDGDGLGVVDFGDEADDALGVLGGILGPPDVDTGWGDPSDPASGPLWPGCPGSIARIVTWEGLLEVVFTDWDQDVDGFRQSVETPYLAGAVLWADSPITTLDGARSGDTVGRLRAVYGDRLWISPRPDEAVGLHHFSVDDETHPGPLHRTGGLRGWVFWPGYPDSPSTAPTVTAEVTPVTDDDVTAGYTAGVSCSTP